MMLAANRGFQQGDLFRIETKQAIHDSVDLALSLLDLGVELADPGGVLGEVALLVAPLLNRDIGSEYALHFLAEGSEVERPPLLQLAGEPRTLRRREIKHAVAGS
jgi:hypothetical protein